MNKELHKGHKAPMECVHMSDRSLEGKYVALADFGTNCVIASGSDPLAVKRTAIAAGFDDPVVSYIPCSDMVHVY